MPFSFCSKPRSALPCPVSKPRPCLRFYFPASNAFSPILFSHIPCNKRPPPFLSASLFNARALALSVYPSKAFLIQPNSFAALAVPCSFLRFRPGGMHFYTFTFSLFRSPSAAFPLFFCIALLCFHPLKFSHSIFCSPLYPLHTYNLFVPLYLPP